eukprot:TRINITY_DN3798_c1_g4_i1.p1 TRINITY_DN3798_c1_g4~~TRINITY_DN3798_c1_g4_i1.p1  ORF type:complete len:392 (-),score=91.07 TRINITY_DN3798_c1_g4_i1:300-1379(-)
MDPAGLTFQAQQDPAGLTALMLQPHSEISMQAQLQAAQQMGFLAQQQQLQLQHQLQQQQQLLQMQDLAPHQAASLARRQAAVPPEPLSQAKIQAIAQELSAAGGRLPLGKVCSKFEGLKRVQLEGIFELAQIGAHGQVEVRLPGMEPVGVMMYGGEVVSQEMPLPPLEPEQIAQITSMIEAAGGIAPLSRITQQVKGVKKQQLEGHFEISSHRIGEKRRQYVRFLGTPLSKGKGKGGPRGTGDALAIPAAQAAAEAAATASANAQLQMAQAQHMMMLGVNPFLAGAMTHTMSLPSIINPVQALGTAPAPTLALASSPSPTLALANSPAPTAAQQSVSDSASVGTKRKFSEGEYDLSKVK